MEVKTWEFFQELAVLRDRVLEEMDWEFTTSDGSLAVRVFGWVVSMRQIGNFGESQDGRNGGEISAFRRFRFQLLSPGMGQLEG